MNISLEQSVEPTQHVTRAARWLQQSAQGEHAVALAYAAFELRLGAERLAVTYWANLLGAEKVAEEIDSIGNFSKMGQRIYELAGHQKEINNSFEFAEIFAELLGIELPAGRSNIPKLKRHWHTCSQLCHIGWTLASGSRDIRAEAYENLQTVLADVAEMAGG